MMALSVWAALGALLVGYAIGALLFVFWIGPWMRRDLGMTGGKK